MREHSDGTKSLVAAMGFDWSLVATSLDNWSILQIDYNFDKAKCELRYMFVGC